MRGFLISSLLLVACGTESPSTLDASHADDAGETGGATTSGTGGKRSTGGARTTTGGRIGAGGIIQTGGGTQAHDAASDAPATATGGKPNDSDARVDSRAPDAYVQSAGGTTSDAGPGDASPDIVTGPCECTDGPCCDGCHLRPATIRCGNRLLDDWCGPWPGPLCGLRSPYILEHRQDRFCSGTSSQCTGEWDSRISSDSRTCPPNTFCHGSIDPGDAGEPPTCGPCF